MSTKDQVLRRLLQYSGTVQSGQELATALGLSRTSVWKAIQSLQKSGVRIRTVPRHGYVLEGLPDHITPEALRVLLDNPWSEAKIRVVTSTTSTNSTLKEQLDGVKHRAILIAEEQTGGRGRYGRSFYSPRGGLYLSFGFHPTRSAAGMRLITMRAALALHDALRETLGVETKIKWVNDLLYRGRKVAGILTEAVWDVETQTISSLIVGIGLNLFPPAKGWPEEIQNRAGSLFDAPGNLSRNVLAATIINHFQGLLSLEDGDITRRYRPLCATLGQTVLYERNGKREEGRAVEILEEGSLLIERAGERFPLQGAEAHLSFESSSTDPEEGGSAR